MIRNALIFGTQKINLHQSGKEFEPKAQNVQPGSADLCFLTDENVENVLQAFQDAKIEVSLSDLTELSLHTNIFLEVLEGAKIVDRTGAVGKIRSVYVRDPDGNLIEYVISHSPPSDY